MSDQDVTEPENPRINRAPETLFGMLSSHRLILLDILEAVRALKPGSFADQAAAAIGSRGLRCDTALDTAEAHIELQKSAVARGYQPGDGAILASLYAANKRQLANIDALRTEVNRQLADNVRLRGENERVNLCFDGLKKTADSQCSETHSEIERLQAVVADQALTIATLKDELARTRHLLSEERALTAAISAHAAQP